MHSPYSAFTQRGQCILVDHPRPKVAGTHPQPPSRKTGGHPRPKPESTKVKHGSYPRKSAGSFTRSHWNGSLVFPPGKRRARGGFQHRPGSFPAFPVDFQSLATLHNITLPFFLPPMQNKYTQKLNKSLIFQAKPNCATDDKTGREASATATAHVCSSQSICQQVIVERQIALTY